MSLYLVTGEKVVFYGSIYTFTGQTLGYLLLQRSLRFGLGSWDDLVMSVPYSEVGKVIPIRDLSPLEREIMSIDTSPITTLG
jgi:hypothetical protein